MFRYQSVIIVSFQRQLMSNLHEFPEEIANLVNRVFDFVRLVDGRSRIVKV
jgi:hypothetical protein